MSDLQGSQSRLCDVDRRDKEAKLMPFYITGSVIATNNALWMMQVKYLLLQEYDPREGLFLDRSQ